MPSVSWATSSTAAYVSTFAKLNAANVMPIIFAQAIMFIPMLFGGKVGAAMANYTGFWYNFVFAILVILFTYFYTAIIVNPNMMADELKRNGGFIPGVKPGKETSRYLDTIMTRITLPGSIFLAIVLFCRRSHRSWASASSSPSFSEVPRC